MFENLSGKSLDRRSFLRGSALFAGAVGVAVAPAAAQQQGQQKPEEPKKDKPTDPFAEDGKGEKVLIDEYGNEYRICPQCGYNMYKEGRMWVCENCGYSYVE